MAATTWPTPNWPQDVPHDISGYEKPLFSVLDESANNYPDQVYTIFNDATRTYAQVKDTADRIANFLASRGILSGYFFWYFKSRSRLRHLQSFIQSK